MSRTSPEPEDPTIASRLVGRLGIARRSAPGAAPGTVVADPEASAPIVRAFLYDDQAVLEERPVEGIAQLSELRKPGARLWLDISGLGDIELLRAVAEQFGLHPLALEDAVHVHQRPKVEVYPDHLFIVVRMLRHEPHLASEQVSIFLLDDAVITMQERLGDCFDPVRERLRDPVAKLRGRGSDYLAYALMDAVVDFGFPVLEQIGDALELLEEHVLVDSGFDAVPEIYVARRELLLVRRAMWPLREALMKMTREPHPPFRDQYQLYLRDAQDHVVQLLDLVESYRELASSLLDVHLSLVGQRTNDVMKTLTLVSTIFIPLGFVAGLYGMNFDTTSPYNMPELSWKFGYPGVVSVMLTITLGLLAYFWRKGWLRS